MRHCEREFGSFSQMLAAVEEAVGDQKNRGFGRDLFNAQVAPHIYCGPVAHAAATHLGFTLPNFLILETILSDFHQQVVASPLDWESGWMLPPREPGLGVHLNHDVWQIIRTPREAVFIWR